MFTVLQRGCNDGMRGWVEMNERFSFAITLLLVVPALVVVPPILWLIAGVLAAISRLAAQMRRGCDGSIRAGV
jgi:hypothetical protein